MNYEVVTETLGALGLTQYEARTYVGLLNMPGKSAYAVSMATGVPQPKIYDALRKLEARGAIAQVGSKPRLFEAVPPDTFIGQLRAEFADRADAAERQLRQTVQRPNEGPQSWPAIMQRLDSLAPILQTAQDMIRMASVKVYISAWDGELLVLEDSFAIARQNGAAVVALTFGRRPFSVDGGLIFRHTSTAKMVYPNHQNRHLALVCDGDKAIWAKFSPEQDWSGLVSTDPRMVSLVRGFIRHDIYVQKTYEQFGPEMEEVFGPGMELLADVFTDTVLIDRTQTVDVEAPRHLRRRRNAG